MLLHDLDVIAGRVQRCEGQGAPLLAVVSVIVVCADRGDVLSTESIDQPPGQGGLSGCACAGDGQNHGTLNSLLTRQRRAAYFHELLGNHAALPLVPDNSRLLRTSAASMRIRSSRPTVPPAATADRPGADGSAQGRCARCGHWRNAAGSSASR